MSNCAKVLAAQSPHAGRIPATPNRRVGWMIEFFFDCSSPWTYLAFHNILPLAREFGEEMQWRPILVGGIFNTINPSVYQSREKPVPAKARYASKDLADWARVAGLKIIRPSIFPVNSVKAMRGCIFLQAEGKLVAFARLVFEAYWGNDRDIANDNVLADICRDIGIDPQSYFAAIVQQTIKDKLRDNTAELMARGGFGSPTIYLDRDDMYFGNDRLPLLREALKRRSAN
jgi:2-hydroxychromene-2-carboxylate isomerase